jgi:hypothetical protein
VFKAQVALLKVFKVLMDSKDFRALRVVKVSKGQMDSKAFKD